MWAAAAAWADAAAPLMAEQTACLNVGAHPSTPIHCLHPPSQMQRRRVHRSMDAEASQQAEPPPLLQVEAGSCCAGLALTSLVRPSQGPAGSNQAQRSQRRSHATRRALQHSRPLPAHAHAEEERTSKQRGTHAQPAAAPLCRCAAHAALTRDKTYMAWQQAADHSPPSNQQPQ